MRDYEFDQEMQSNQSEAAKALKASADKKRAQLEEWSASAYGEVSCCYPDACPILYSPPGSDIVPVGESVKSPGNWAADCASFAWYQLSQ